MFFFFLVMLGVMYVSAKLNFPLEPVVTDVEPFGYGEFQNSLTFTWGIPSVYRHYWTHG